MQTYNAMKFLTAAVSVLIMASCGHSEAHQHDAEAASAEQHDHHEGEIVMSVAQQRAMGVVAESIEPTAFHGVIATGGRLVEATGDEVAVVAGMSGVVRLARPLDEGAAVAAGSVLASISASHIQGGDPAAQARVSYEAAKAEYERARRLAAEKIVSQSELDALRAQFEAARLAVEATPQGRDGKSTAVVSPVGGYVKARLVGDGDYVTAGQTIAVVARGSRLYLKADLPERHFAQAGEIVSAKFRPAGSDRVYDLKQLDGSLVAVGRSASQSPGYVPVTFVCDAADGLMPGAYAETWLLTAPREGALTVPAGAIVEQQGVYSVFVAEDSTCFERRQVAVGQTDGERVELLSGVHAGERVVTQGAVSVRLASASNAIPGHTHNH